MTFNQDTYHLIYEHIYTVYIYKLSTEEEFMKALIVRHIIYSQEHHRNQMYPLKRYDHIDMCLKI